MKVLFLRMKLVSSTLLDYSLLYGVILFGSCVFLFAVLEIYFDRRKNLWNIPGPIPLPLFGNSLLFAKPHELFMPTLKAVSNKYLVFHHLPALHRSKTSMALLSVSTWARGRTSSLDHLQKTLRRSCQATNRSQRSDSQHLSNFCYLYLSFHDAGKGL